MSPEQVEGKELDPRTDVFSFRIVLYEMATGKAAFERGTTGATFGAILHEQPGSPSRLNAAIPPRVEEIIQKALEKDRNLRYQHASEIRSDLKRLKRDTESGRIALTEGKSGPWRVEQGYIRRADCRCARAGDSTLVALQASLHSDNPSRDPSSCCCSLLVPRPTTSDFDDHGQRHHRARRLHQYHRGPDLRPDVAPPARRQTRAVAVSQDSPQERRGFRH